MLRSNPSSFIRLPVERVDDGATKQVVRANGAMEQSIEHRPTSGRAGRPHCGRKDQKLLPESNFISFLGIRVHVIYSTSKDFRHSTSMGLGFYRA